MPSPKVDPTVLSDEDRSVLAGCLGGGKLRRRCGPGSCCCAPAEGGTIGEVAELSF